MLRFVIDVVKTLDTNRGLVRIGLLTYNTRANVEFFLGQYHSKRTIIKAIRRTRFPKGGTNTADGILRARRTMFRKKNGDRLDVPNVLVVVTSALSDVNPHRTIPQASAAKEDGIKVFTVGVDLPNLREVNAISSQPLSNHRILVENFDLLDDATAVLSYYFCTGLFAFPSSSLV